MVARIKSFSQSATVYNLVQFYFPLIKRRLAVAVYIEVINQRFIVRKKKKRH